MPLIYLTNGLHHLTLLIFLNVHLIGHFHWLRKLVVYLLIFKVTSEGFLLQFNRFFECFVFVRRWAERRLTNEILRKLLHRLKFDYFVIFIFGFVFCVGSDWWAVWTLLCAWLVKLGLQQCSFSFDNKFRGFYWGDFSWFRFIVNHRWLSIKFRRIFCLILSIIFVAYFGCWDLIPLISLILICFDWWRRLTINSAGVKFNFFKLTINDWSLCFIRLHLINDYWRLYFSFWSVCLPHNLLFCFICLFSSFWIRSRFVVLSWAHLNIIKVYSKLVRYYL